ncbi:MAG: tetratricopeptide repeat protein [Pyrinomonadaceae bacterium]
MLRKSFFTLAAIIALYALGASAAFAQTGQLRGHVLFRQADGTTIPAADATIDVYRTDISGHFPTKTNKKGEFIFAGLPFVGTYAIAASMPNAQPTYQPGVKVGRDIDYELVLTPGDGRRITPEQIKAGVASAGNASAPTGGGGGESAADKAKREELLKKNAEIEVSNRKAGEINEIVGRTFKVGNDALKLKNYDEAIKQYREGLAADPEQAALLTNLSVALRARGVDRYNQGIQSKDESAKASGAQDFRDASEAGTKAVEFLKSSAGSTPDEQAKNNVNKYFAYFARAEALRLLVTKVDPAQADACLTAFQEYIALETDAVKKKKAELDAARMLLDAGQSSKALAEYKKILAINPDDADANFGAGLSMFGEDNKESYQQAANYLQHFVDVAPDAHPFKEEAKGILAELKNTQKVEPVKMPARRAGRRP